MTTMTNEQVYATVQEMRQADYNKVGTDFFQSRVERMKAANWVLGIEAYRALRAKTRNGKRNLRIPRYEWRNIAYFYHQASETRVFYWDNPGMTKAQAQDLAKRTRPPQGAYYTHIGA